MDTFFLGTHPAHNTPSNHYTFHSVRTVHQEGTDAEHNLPCGATQSVAAMSKKYMLIVDTDGTTALTSVNRMAVFLPNQSQRKPPEAAPTPPPKYRRELRTRRDRTTTALGVRR